MDRCTVGCAAAVGSNTDPAQRTSLHHSSTAGVHPPIETRGPEHSQSHSPPARAPRPVSAHRNGQRHQTISGIPLLGQRVPTKAQGGARSDSPPRGACAVPFSAPCMACSACAVRQVRVPEVAGRSVYMWVGPSPAPFSAPRLVSVSAPRSHARLGFLTATQDSGKLSVASSAPHVSFLP